MKGWIMEILCVFWVLCWVLVTSAVVAAVWLLKLGYMAIMTVLLLGSVVLVGGRKWLSKIR